MFFLPVLGLKNKSLCFHLYLSGPQNLLVLLDLLDPVTAVLTQTVFLSSLIAGSSLNLVSSIRLVLPVFFFFFFFDFFRLLPVCAALKVTRCPSPPMFVSAPEVLFVLEFWLSRRWFLSPP